MLKAITKYLVFACAFTPLAYAVGAPDDALLVQLPKQAAPAETLAELSAPAEVDDASGDMQGAASLASGVQAEKVDAAKSSLEAVSAAALLNRPNQLYQELNKGRTEFESVVEQLRKENTEAMATQKQLYEKKLHERYQENDKISAAITALETHVSDLKDGNVKLRSAATKLIGFNSQLRRDLQLLQANLSTAQEYLSVSLKDFDDKGAPELDVLHELDSQDASAAADKAHVARLKGVDEFGRKELSMLQESRPMPTDLIQKLQSDLDQLTQEEERSEASLKALFLKDYKAAVTRHAELVQRQDELTTVANGLTALKQRLTDAVLHLEKTHDGLSDRLSSLRNYAQRIGMASSDTPAAPSLAAMHRSEDAARAVANAASARSAAVVHVAQEAQAAPDLSASEGNDDFYNDESTEVSTKISVGKQGVALTESSSERAPRTAVHTDSTDTIAETWRQKLTGLLSR